MPVEIAGCVAVVTGASSGIGRATSVALAERGASVVLVARGEQALEDTRRTCAATGARTLSVSADVVDEHAVERLARRTYDEFGRIDVWINGAAVMAYGAFREIPTDVFRRVIETNLFGQINGARAVLPYFHEQGRGVLINMASVWGDVSSPYVSPYVISKFGVRALSECLQQAMVGRKETRDIHVCTVLPQSVDTPIFRHAANYLGCRIRPVPPIIGTERVVDTVLDLIENPRARVTVGRWGRFLEVGYVLAPPVFRRIVPYAMRLGAIRRKPAEATDGNVFESRPEWNRVSGDWRRHRPAVRAAGLAAAGTAGIAAASAAVRRYKSRQDTAPL